MSASFQGVMRDISRILKGVYNANGVAIVPGSGTFGMEAVARQFATGKKCLVVRNGWFSYRWTQILDAGNIASESIVLKARRTSEVSESPFIPCPIEEVVSTILKEKPNVVFAPHVETSAGLILPDGYIKAMADAVHSVGGLLVIDCIASGTLWLDMKALGIDVLVSAPQKGWSGSPCCGLVMLSETGVEATRSSQSTSFACDLGKWLQIMEAYENGGHAYHATPPTDGLAAFRDVMLEIEALGFDTTKAQAEQLGSRVRAMMEAKGIKSVAADGFKAPGVVVSYTRDKNIQNGSKFMNAGLQVAAGVPLQCDEPADYQTFRIGLFGLDKLQNIDRTVESLEKAIAKVMI
jgi:aspartate aminotransferase-like enzyme